MTNAPVVVTPDQNSPAHWLKQIYGYLQYDQREGTLQLHHRGSLVNLWFPEPGSHILEIGCGQGETTVVLAVAAGPTGRVLAVDKSAAEYGGPVTLAESHAHIKSSVLGDRIDFLLSTDLLAIGLVPLCGER
jgi:2-polyprenyl-3-methyl-5-hydroxy-6-metoxy-1,4-benzoquinol methylase